MTTLTTEQLAAIKARAEQAAATAEVWKHRTLGGYEHAMQAHAAGLLAADVLALLAERDTLLARVAELEETLAVEVAAKDTAVAELWKVTR